MRTTYCEGWFRWEKRPTRIWDESKARAAHERGRLYAVVLGEIESPESFLEITGDFVGVSFLDKHLREYLDYRFQTKEPGRLRMTTAITREFAAETDELKMATVYHFQDDGRVLIREEDREAGMIAEGEIPVELTQAWANYPAFGNYREVAWKGRLDAVLATWDGKSYRTGKDLFSDRDLD